jgi:SAM-dependent methyltransferase
VSQNSIRRRTPGVTETAISPRQVTRHCFAAVHNAGGRRIEWFVSNGCDVTGIDIRSGLNDYSKIGLKFILTSLEDYRPERLFDVVVAMYVMPFVKCTWEERIAHLTRLMTPGALLLLTGFAPDDGWASESHITTISEEAIRDLLARHMLKVRYKCHEQYDGPTYEGSVKAWSVIGVVAELAAPITL